MADFVTVLEADELAEGEGTVVDANGHTIALFHTDGDFQAIGNECTHSGGPLGDGEVEDEVVTCPWHGAQFDVDSGEVLDGPADDSVPDYEVRVDGDEVQVGV
jgi:nitrite reductase/ring-hydroxylating ferredoxin subunit